MSAPLVPQKHHLRRLREIQELRKQATPKTEKMNPLTWTAEKPTKAGYYWCRQNYRPIGGENKGVETKGSVEIVAVGITRIRTKECFAVSGRHWGPSKMEKIDDAWEWAGPIEAPREK